MCTYCHFVNSFFCVWFVWGFFCCCCFIVHFCSFLLLLISFLVVCWFSLVFCLGSFLYVLCISFVGFWFVIINDVYVYYSTSVLVHFKLIGIQMYFIRTAILPPPPHFMLWVSYFRSFYVLHLLTTCSNLSRAWYFFLLIS